MLNFGLYKEGLKRSMILSLLFIITMMLGAVLIPIANIMSQMRSIENGWFHGPIIVSGFGDNIALFIALIAFAPILTLYLFSFLNNRNSSDFYHSIPHKRETLFISFTASILTWVLGGIWLCTAVTMAIYSFSSAYVIIDMPTVLFTTIGLSIACILVIGATLIAMSVTSSAFSNIIATLLILFLPRIIITSFIAIVIDLTRVVSIENFGFIGNNSYNIVFGFVTLIFNPSIHLYQLFTQGIFYTAILGLIYLGIGLILFKRRKSEASQTPALNNYIQATVRIALAFLVCIPAVWGITYLINREAGFRYDDILSLITIYTIALIVYFAYELITTKKLKSIIKALPGLGILVLLNIIFITGITFTQNAILDRELEVNEVASVQVMLLHERHLSGSLPYGQHLAQNVKIQDDELTSILLLYLAREVAQARKGNTPFFQGNQRQITAVFETTSRQTIRRNFPLPENAILTTLEILNQHEEYRAAALTLPENPSEIWSGRFNDLSEEALRDTYETLREEVRDLDLMIWQRIAWTFPNRFADIIHYGELHVTSTLGRGHTYMGRYSITNFTPRTADKFIQHTNNYNFEATEYLLEIASASSDEHINIFINVHNDPDYHNVPSSRARFVDQDVAKILLEAIREQQDNPVNREQVHYSIEISNFMPRPNELIQGRFFFNSDNAELLRFLSNN